MQWSLDSSHTSLEMSARHMGLFTVRGSFDRVSGSAENAEDGTLTDVRGTIEAASINTREPQRDAHLRSADFLDADNYPQITFRSTQIESIGDGRLYRGGRAPSMPRRGVAAPAWEAACRGKPIPAQGSNGHV